VSSPLRPISPRTVLADHDRRLQIADVGRIVAGSRWQLADRDPQSAWFAGSTALGALFGVSLGGVVVSAVAQLAAFPLILLVRRRSAVAPAHRR